MLRERIKKPPIVIPMLLQFKVTLQGIQPAIWRRFLVHNQISFHQFHEVLQEVLGWEHDHLYEFQIGDQRIGLSEPDFSMDAEYDSEIEIIGQHLTKKRNKVQYIYDFGDYWVHDVVLEKVLPDNGKEKMPICLDGKGNCPPEDCGGVFGYAVLTDPKHPEYKEMREWLGEDYDPNHFDVQEINSRLRNYFD